MGAGKSAVLAEASDILALRGIAHAAIDLDALGLAYLPGGSSNQAMFQNLGSICANYKARGINLFLVARALETRAELDFCWRAAGAEHTVVCRLIASVAAMKRRVALRESGVRKEEFLARAARLNEILDRAALEDFTVENENRPLTEVAEEVLRKASWV